MFGEILTKARTFGLFAYLPGGVVGVLTQLFVHAFQADDICDFAHRETGLIQDGDDAFMRLLHQVHYDLIVEVFNLKKKQCLDYEKLRFNRPYI